MKKPHKKLDAWKLSMDLVIEIYKETDKFPNHERYGLIARFAGPQLVSRVISQKAPRDARERNS